MPLEDSAITGGDSSRDDVAVVARGRGVRLGVMLDLSKCVRVSVPTALVSWLLEKRLLGKGKGHFNSLGPDHMVTFLREIHNVPRTSNPLFVYCLRDTYVENRGKRWYY